MSTLAILLAGLALIGAPLSAQPASVSQQFDAANEAYAQGRYGEAVEGYRDILDAGHASAALYHNLGNAYVRLDRVGPAVWAYERGRRLRPDDPRLRHNLDYVRRRAELPRSSLPPRGLAALVAGWPPLLLFGLGVLVLCGGVLGTVLRAAPGRLLAWPSPGEWGAVGGGLLLVAVALGTSYVQAQERRGVVMEAAVPLRTAPTDSVAADTTLRPGTMLDLRARRGDWTRVRLGDRSEGWVATRQIGDV
jgi:tetratricopeptide (TPR) repeat protein